MNKMSRGEYISLEIIDRICNYFECDVSDILMHTNEG